MGNVVAKSYGRCGNQMFISAVAASYAKRTGRTFCGLIRGYYNEPYVDDTILKNIKFHNDKDFDLSNYEINEMKNTIGDGICPEFTKDNVCFNGYFQDITLIDKNVAYDLFSPDEKILKDIYDMYGDLSDYVCVNIRRGDYLQYDFTRVFSVDEVKQILNKHFHNEKKVIFVSDDIEWCKTNFSDNKKPCFADKQYYCKPYIDLYIQTQCKSNIISNSTFSWWGAYLNKHPEKVVCHWPWFKNGSVNDCKYILPKDWIKECS